MKITTKLLERTLDEVLAATLVEPRPYQRRIIIKAAKMYLGLHTNSEGVAETDIASVMVESPTGSGKTVIGLLLAKLLQTMLAKQGTVLHVGWIAMRRNLLAQAERENGQQVMLEEEGEMRQFGKQIYVENITFVSMFDKFPEPLINARKDKDAGKSVRILLVIDEAQHDAATSCMHLHNLIQPDWIMGLSATPFRTDKMKLCFNKVIKDAGIHTLIQDGFLSAYDHFTIPNWSPECVFEAYVREMDRWGKSVFYFKNLTLCWELARMFERAGLPVHVVTGETDVDEQLASFRAGTIPRLINCMKLTEGWDEPSLHTAWVRDSGKGCTTQMGGRAFRKHMKTPRKNIVQSKMTRWPFIRTAMPVQQYLWQETEWRSLTVNPHLNLINQNAKVAIAMTPVSLPEFLTKQNGKRKKLKFW